MAIEPSIDIGRFSNLMHLKRTMGWMLRFIGNIQNNGTKVKGEISFKELVNVEKALC